MDCLTRDEETQPRSRLERSGLPTRRKVYPEPMTQRSRSLDERTTSRYMDYRDEALPSGVAPVDIFIISRLNDSSSYFFSWFCKRYRIRIGARDSGGKEENHPCPICLDACTKSIELQCGHAFCRSCLATSAANNMTACALCRREQVINPELLRAWFDEQRMLNLAQRLALPPPVRTCSTSMAIPLSTAGVARPKEDGTDASNGAISELENEEVATDSLINMGSKTTRDHLLYEPWSNVGAMPADELRSRWKCSGKHLATSPSPETVGAKSAAELRCSWRRLQRMICASTGVRNRGEYVGTALQASRNNRGQYGIDGPLGEDGRLEGEISLGGRTLLETPDSLYAGGSSLDELSARWRSLMRLSSANAVSSNLIPDRNIDRRYHSTTIDASVGERGCIQLHVERSTPLLSKDPFASAFDNSSQAAYVDDVGNLSNVHLRKRWSKARGPFRRECDVGEVEVHQLSVRLAVATENQCVGALSPISLKQRWNALRPKDFEAESCPELVENDRKIMGYSSGELGAGSSRGDVDFAEELGADAAAAPSTMVDKVPLG